MDLRNFEIKNEMKKSQTKFKNLNHLAFLAHELSSYLVSQVYLFYSFPSHNIYVSGRLYMELFGKVIVLPRYYK
jgi:hypothetical protein